MSENNEHKLYCTDYRPCRFCMVLLHFLFGVAMGPTKPQIWKFHWRAGRGSRRCFGIHEFHAKSSSSWGAKKKQNLDLGLEDVWSVVSCVFSCFCCNQLFFSGVMMLNYWLSYVIHNSQGETTPAGELFSWFDVAFEWFPRWVDHDKSAWSIANPWSNAQSRWWSNPNVWMGLWYPLVIQHSHGNRTHL